MMAYDRQLIDLQRYTTRKQFFREGREELDPHS
jgi:hypothetical protein